MRALLFLLLSACSIPAGDNYSVQAVVVEAGGGSVILDHSGVPDRLAPDTQRFDADPNLSRLVKVGDVVEAQVLLNEGADPRVIGFKVIGHEEPAQAVPVAIPALAVGELLPTLSIPGVSGPITLGQGQGVPTVLTFLFTSCPMPEKCPLVASKIVQLQGPLQGKARVVTVTLDPARDSLEVLGRYAQDRGGDPSTWLLGRLELPELQTLLQRAGVARVEKQADILHSLHVLVLDADGRLIWRGDDNAWDVNEVQARVLGAGVTPPGSSTQGG